MKSFTLIFKNNWHNVKKLKGVFVLLFLIIVFFSTVFSLFWEFNRQFKSNINAFDLASKNADFIDESTTMKKTAVNAFCTDFTEIYDKDKKLKRRLPVLSFGGQNGCFQPIPFEDIDFSYELSSTLNKQNKKFRVLRIENVNISASALKINEKSIFYQKSIHGLLLKKFVETKNINFLNSARWLEKNYFQDFLKFYQLKIQAYLNQKLKQNPVYTSVKTSRASIDVVLRNYIKYKFKLNVFPRYKTDSNFNETYEKLTILHGRLNDFKKNSDPKILQTNFKFYFQNIIENIIFFLKKTNFDNTDLKRKYIYILNQPKIDWSKFNFIIKNKDFFTIDSEKISIVDNQNSIYLVKLIDNVLQNKNDFIKNNQLNQNYQKIIKHLMTWPEDITFTLRQVFLNLFPTFELQWAIKNAFENHNYGNDRKEALKIFNYNNQTLTELWNSKKFNIYQKKIILQLISLIKPKYEATIRLKHFKTNQTELIKLEQTLFGNQTKSNQILATQDPVKIDILIRNFFDIISMEIQNLKNKFVKYENFYGIKSNDILTTEKEKFYSHLTSGFQLNIDFFEKTTSPKDYLNEIFSFIETANSLIHKIIDRGLSKTNSRSWIANNLKVTSAQDLDKVITKFNDLVNPHNFRYDKWHLFKNWISLFLSEKLITSKPREETITDANKYGWNQLLDSNFFSKYFTYFYNGLETLSQADYLTFQNDFTDLKTNIFNLEKTLLIKNINQIPPAQQNRLFKFQTPNLEYEKTFSLFKIDVQTNVLDNLIKDNPAYLLSNLFDWMYPTDSTDQNPDILNKNIDYFELVFSKIVYLTNLIHFLPSAESAIEKLDGNYTPITNYLTNKIKWRALRFYYVMEQIVKNISNSYHPKLLDRFKTLGLISQLETPFMHKGKLIKDLKVEYNQLETPPILKHWFLKFGNGNSPITNSKIVFDENNKPQFVDLLLNNDQFNLFEKSQKLLNQPPTGYESFTQSIISQPLLVNTDLLLAEFLKKYIEFFKSLLPADLKDKFTITKIDQKKLIEIINWDSPSDLKVLRVNNFKTEFATPYFFINFTKAPNINVDKVIVQANQQLNTYVKNVFWKSSTGSDFIFALTNWDNQTFFYKIPKFKNPPYRDKVKEEYVKTKNDAYNQKFTKIYGSVFGIKINFLTYIFSQDKKTNRSNLIIANDDDLKVVLKEGYSPKRLNEIVISPLFAAANKIKIGDNISIFNINNFKVTGLGTSKRFVYPALNYVNLIPRSKDNIIFVHPKIINKLLEKLKSGLNSGFYIKKDFIFYAVDTNQSKNQKYNDYYAYNWAKMFNGRDFGNKNYSQFSEKLFPDSLNNYQILDSDFNQFQKQPIQLPFKFNILVPNVIYKTVLYVFIYVIVVLFLISIFSIWHLLEKKIEINRWQLGILKAFGFGNFFLLVSLLSFTIFLIMGVFCGWIIGTILQKPFFGLFSDKIIFKFDYFYFNYASFYICLACVITFTLLSLVLYNFFRFQHLSSPVLLNRSLIIERGKFATSIPTLVKRFIIHPFWRLNYIFFDTVGKKILMLFFIVVLISINFVSVVFFTSAFYKTEQFWKQSTQKKWQFFYNSPIKGNPLSRFPFYLNRGAESIWNDQKNSNEPTDDLSADVYLFDGEKFVYQKLTIAEVLGYFRVLQNKVINYNKINSLLNQNEKSQSITNLKSNVCLIIKNIFKDKKLDKLDCLNNIINRAIPFIDFPDAKKENNTKKHFPIAFNSVPFYPEKDELFTKLKGNMISNANDLNKFDILGYNSQSKFFKIESEANLKAFFATKPDSNQKIIPIIVNRYFKDKFKKKIGDTLQLSIKYRQMMFQENEHTKIELKNSDWVYFEKSATGKILKTPIDDLPYDYQFYQGRFLMNANLDLKNPNKYRIINQNFENKALEIVEYFDTVSKTWKTYFPHYKTKRKNQDKYFKYINVDNIGLKTQNNFWFPFRYTKETADKLDKVSVFFDWIQNQKVFVVNKTLTLKNPENQLYNFKIIDIHSSIDSAKLYLPQSFLNYQTWGDASKTDNFSNSSENPLLFFNARATSSKELYNAFFNFSLTNDIGFLDLNTIQINQKTLVSGFKSYLETKYKIQFFQFAFEIIWILILFNLITLMALFGLMVKIIFDIFRKKIILLRILGYKIYEIALQVFLIMFVPILVAFIIASVISKVLFDYLIQFLIDNYQIYIFYISDPWIFIACFAVFLFFWLLLFGSYFYSIRKAKIETYLKES